MAHITGQVWAVAFGVLGGPLHFPFYVLGTLIVSPSLLRVNNGLYRQPCHTSAYPPEADVNDAKAEVAVGMSAVGGRADVACQGLSGPFLATSGHWMD